MPADTEPELSVEQLFEKAWSTNLFVFNKLERATTVRGAPSPFFVGIESKGLAAHPFCRYSF